MSNPNPVRIKPVLPHPLDEEAQKWWDSLRSKKGLRAKSRGMTITEIYLKWGKKEIYRANETSTRIST
jgi:hypothetical protein